MTGRPGPWPRRCSVLLLQLRLFGVCLCLLSAINSYIRTMHFWQIASGVSCTSCMTPCANVGSKPWYRCGCTDDTPCRLGDADSMTFLPWFVPRKEPPVQLREVDPDKGHLLTESCNDIQLYMCRCRTGDEDCCCSSVRSRRQYITCLLYTSPSPRD